MQPATPTMKTLLLFLLTASGALADGFAPESIGNMIYNNVVTTTIGGGGPTPAGLRNTGLFASTGYDYKVNANGVPLSDPVRYVYHKTSPNVATLEETEGINVSTATITFTGPFTGFYYITFNTSRAIFEGEIALTPIPDTVSSPPEVPLTNISARASLAPGQVLNPGFTVSGAYSHRVLIRAVGPTLASFGVTGAAQVPTITVYSGDREVATNAGWGGNSGLVDVFAMVGAFALPSDSRDAAMAITLRPGNYTVVVTGPGEVLAEIYFID